MDIFGIGPLELLFIVLIILIVLGPNEMVKAARTIGELLRKLVTSEWWRSVKQSIEDVRKLPYTLMRDAGMDEDLKAIDEITRSARFDLKQDIPDVSDKPSKTDLSAWTQTSLPQGEPKPEINDQENHSILPPGTNLADPTDQDTQSEITQEDEP